MVRAKESPTLCELEGFTDGRTETEIRGDRPGQELTLSDENVPNSVSIRNYTLNDV